jgi:acyl-CoA thioester hydrolase
METRFRVRYAETDQMGVVHHANYLVWMEIGRVELCRSRGVNYAEMEANDGILLVVVDAHCRYHAPARYDDEVIVKTWIEESRPRMVTFGYEIRVAEGDRKVATGRTRHIFCDSNLRPCRLPEKYTALFGMNGE